MNRHWCCPYSRNRNAPQGSQGEGTLPWYRWEEWNWWILRKIGTYALRNESVVWWIVDGRGCRVFVFSFSTPLSNLYWCIYSKASFRMYMVLGSSRLITHYFWRPRGSNFSACLGNYEVLSYRQIIIKGIQSFSKAWKDSKPQWKCYFWIWSSRALPR